MNSSKLREEDGTKMWSPAVKRERKKCGKIRKKGKKKSVRKR